MSRKPGLRRSLLKTGARRCLAATISPATRQVDTLTEEQLLRGLESMTPSEPSSNGSGGPRDRGR